MKLFFKLDAIATRLEVTLASNADETQLRAAAIQAAADLRAEIEKLAPMWGDLIGAVKALEKGEPRAS